MLVEDRLSRILQAIWEPEFRECSYGFRPDRNAHQALARLEHIIVKERTQWVYRRADAVRGGAAGRTVDLQFGHGDGVAQAGQRAAEQARRMQASLAIRTLTRSPALGGTVRAGTGLTGRCGRA